MNSTDAAAPDTDSSLAERLGRFHDEVLAALTTDAAAPPAPFPLAPDARCASYWVSRPRPVMQRADFLAPSCLDEAELAQALAAYWTDAGQPQLASLAPRLATLAAAARAQAAQQSDEVSPFIYTLF